MIQVSISILLNFTSGRAIQLAIVV